MNYYKVLQCAKSKKYHFYKVMNIDNKFGYLLEWVNNIMDKNNENIYIITTSKSNFDVKHIIIRSTNEYDGIEDVNGIEDAPRINYLELPVEIRNEIENSNPDNHHEIN